ncbi:hypothetical protein R3P38DRAFT_2516976, partial [Favolaschia claudopus]
NLIHNFQGKGTSRNQKTRVGEGFQQEVSEMYQIINGKNAEHQIALIDENEEAMARLDMQVTAWKKSQEEAGDELVPSPEPQSTAHWSLGAPGKRTSPMSLESKEKNNKLFRDFNMNLRQYLAHHHPSHPRDRRGRLFM